MDEPDYFICLECEAATYEFEFLGGKLISITCGTCGNDDVAEFLTQGDYDDLA